MRPARSGDSAVLARLSSQLGYPMTESEAEERFAEIEDGPQAVLVAESEGRVVGWIQVLVSVVFESPRQAEIAGLVVDETARGAGIGALLVAEAERWARERRCEVIRVRSNVIRERAHAFYRRAGFGEIKVQRVFEKPLGSDSADPARTRPETADQ